MVRRRKPSSAEGTRGGEHERGIIPPLVRWVCGPPPRKFLSAFMCVLMGFYAFWTRFNRFGHKDISCRVRIQMLDKIVFRQSHIFFSSACFFDIISCSYVRFSLDTVHKNDNVQDHQIMKIIRCHYNFPLLSHLG